MGTSENFVVNWHGYDQFMTTAFRNIREKEELSDVTISCEDHTVQAHKIILAACSPYFRKIFKEYPCDHPIVILSNIEWQELKAILHYIYSGTLTLKMDRAADFLLAAESLSIYGLHTLTGAIVQKHLEMLERRKEESNEKSIIQQKMVKHNANGCVSQQQKVAPAIKSINHGTKDKSGYTRVFGITNKFNEETTEPPSIPSHDNFVVPFTWQPKPPECIKNEQKSLEKPNRYSQEMNKHENIKAETMDWEPQHMKLHDLKNITNKIVMKNMVTLPGFVHNKNDVTSYGPLKEKNLTQPPGGRPPFPFPSNFVNDRYAPLPLMIPSHSTDDYQQLESSSLMSPSALEENQRKLAFHEPRPCHFCSRVYRDAATLRTHISIMHTAGETLFLCTCGKQFLTKYEVSEHRKNGHQ